MGAESAIDGQRGRRTAQGPLSFEGAGGCEDGLGGCCSGFAYIQASSRDLGMGEVETGIHQKAAACFPLWGGLGGRTRKV